MSARNRFLIVMTVILVIASTYYFLYSWREGSGLGGDRHANQIVVSPQIQGEFSSCW